MQSVPITTDVVSSNLDQGKWYNIIICGKVVSDLWQVGGFHLGFPVSSTNKTDRLYAWSFFF